MTKNEADPNELFAQKVLAVDFDGVIMKQCVWNGQEDTRGTPQSLFQMKHELETLRNLGWKIVVWSARSKIGLVDEWLKKYKLDHLFDAINRNPWSPDNLKTARKIPAHAYLDDRSIEFSGDWKNIAQTVERFKPYWEK